MQLVLHLPVQRSDITDLLSDNERCNHVAHARLHGGGAEVGEALAPPDETIVSLDANQDHVEMGPASRHQARAGAAVGERDLEADRLDPGDARHCSPP